jgi:hypothetical protein
MHAALLVAVVGLVGASPENSVLTQLTGQGVPVGDGTFVKLPPPTMADSLDAAAQQAILERIAAPHHRVADLTRKSKVSPFVLKLGDVSTSDPNRPFRTIDVWFIAYGRLELFSDEEFLKKLVESAESGKKSRLPFTKGVLKPDEMKQLGVYAEDTPDRMERFFFNTFDLFERVVATVTRRVVVTRYPDSAVVAAIIDPRFTRSNAHPNQWQSVSRDDRDQFKLGPPQPYESAGLYAKVTRLKEPAGALLIEYHHVFCEPEPWFSGSHLLRSKIPLVVQDVVRNKIRHFLTKADSRDGK